MHNTGQVWVSWDSFPLQLCYTAQSEIQ